MTTRTRWRTSRSSHRLVREHRARLPERVCQASAFKGPIVRSDEDPWFSMTRASALIDEFKIACHARVPGAQSITGRARLAVPAPPVVNEPSPPSTQLRDSEDIAGYGSGRLDIPFLNLVLALASDECQHFE